MNTSIFDWSCKHTWKASAKNTMWCVIGCSIGDFGTILFFQLTEIAFSIMGIMILAIINGLITSIILETFILIRQNFSFINALKKPCMKAITTIMTFTPRATPTMERREKKEIIYERRSETEKK